jgi:hypothetical protein
MEANDNAPFLNGRGTLDIIVETLPEQACS